MTDEAAILYAIQQMEKIGKKPGEYRIELVTVACTTEESEAGYFQIKAFNERYVLFNQEKYYGLQIISDDSGFNSDNPIDNGAPEFTGFINFIRIAESWNLQNPLIAPPPTGDGGHGGAEPTRGGGGAFTPVEFMRVVIY